MSNFSSFPHYFIYIFLTSGVKLHIHLLNVVVQFIGFLTLSTLICRVTDISNCESFGIRDNESRLYFFFSLEVLIVFLFLHQKHVCLFVRFIRALCLLVLFGLYLAFNNLSVRRIFDGVFTQNIRTPNALSCTSNNIHTCECV